MSVSKWAYSPEKCDRDFCPGDCGRCVKSFGQAESAEDKLAIIEVIMKQLLIMPNRKREIEGPRYGEWSYMPARGTRRECYEALYQIQELLRTRYWSPGDEYNVIIRVKPKPTDPSKITVTRLVGHDGV